MLHKEKLKSGTKLPKSAVCIIRVCVGSIYKFYLVSASLLKYLVNTDDTN